MAKRRLRPSDYIVGQGLIWGEALAAEIRERLAGVLSRAKAHMSDQELLGLAREMLTELAPELAENIAQADLAAWVAGYDHVAGQIQPWSIASVGKSFYGQKGPPTGGDWLTQAFGGDRPKIRFPLLDKAASSLLKRGVMLPKDYYAADALSHRIGFTVTADLTEDALATIRDTLGESVAEGTSLTSWKQKLKERLDTSMIGPGHLENVYRTNVQTAFHDGHEALAQNPIVAEMFPYQAYYAIHDGRVREEHLALETLGLNGTNIYRRDDPFWDAWTPPNGYQCRCSINLMTRSAAARLGVKEAQEWLRTGRPPEHPEHRLQYIPFENAPGFGARRPARLAA